MDRKMLGTRLFVGLSLLLWGVAAYLYIQARGSGSSLVFSQAVAFTAALLSLHAFLHARFAGRKAQQAEWFRRHGRPVTARITKLGRRGHRTAWRIKASCQDPVRGGERVFKSDILRANPGRKYRLGDTLTVYLHPTDERRYWMDVEVESKYL